MTDFLYNIAFERTILCSILFDPQKIENINLETNDFYLPAHQNIYKAMQQLQKSNIPIDEEFIKKILIQNKSFDEQVMIEIMAANPASNIADYINEIKNNKFKRDFSLKINNLKAMILDASSSEIIQEFSKTIKSLENSNPNKSIFNIESTKNIEIKLPEFFLEEKLPIQKNEITIISAKGGSGKSYLGLFLLSLLIKYHNLKVFGYFSEDDKGITKNRLNKLNEIHNLGVDIDILGKESRPQPFIQYNKNRNLEITQYFYEFKRALKDYDVILIDPLIAFIADDENSNTEARFFMNLLNEWCEEENKTIILIHHHAKGAEGGIRGAGAFVDAVRLHYTINKPTTKEDGKEIEEKESPYRIVKLMKTNHYSGKDEFKIQLFKTNIKEVVYEYKSEKKLRENEVEKIGMPTL